MIKKLILILLSLILLFLSNISFVRADIVVPPTLNIVYFTLDEKPHNKPVDFKIVCYRYNSFPERAIPIKEKDLKTTYQPAKVYSWSASCPNYGCRIEKSHNLNFKYIDYCILYGKTKNRQFTTKSFDYFPTQNCGVKGKNFMTQCIFNFAISSSDLVENHAPVPFSFPWTYEQFFLQSLFLTIFLETLTLFLLIRLFSKKLNMSIKIIDIISVGITSSGLTLPYLWFVLPSLVSLPYPLSLLTTITGELLTVLVEFYLIVKFLKIPKKYALFFSLIVNTLSFLYGKLGLL